MKKFEELEAIQKKKADIAKAVCLDADHHFQNGVSQKENEDGNEQEVECDYHYRGELNEDELRELYSRIGSVFDSDDNDDELFH